MDKSYHLELFPVLFSWFETLFRLGTSRLSSKLRHFWMFFNHYDIIVEGELTHPFLKIEVLESSDSVLLLRRRMAASKWKRYSNVIARDLSLSCLLLLVLFGAAELGFLHSQQSHRTAIHGATVEVQFTIHSMRFSKYSWISCIWTIMAFQRGFYSSLFAESHILDSQSQNDMNISKKVSFYNIASEASNVGKE